MGITRYVLIYLAVGYVVAAIAACFGGAVEGERVDKMAALLVFGWGVLAIFLLWRLLCLPILLLRRARLRMGE